MPQDSINELLKRLKAEFLTTLPERLGEIERFVLDLTDEDDVGNLLRVVHSLKGAAGTHGYQIFTKICHQMEDMMRELLESNAIHSQKAVDLLLSYNDLMEETLGLLNNDESNISAIEQKLGQLSSTIESQQCKVLVAEPSPLYASMIASVLDAENCQTKIVTDGLSALQDLLMQDYDVVITAKELPILNGEALVSALRISENKNKDAKIILITTRQRSSIAHADIFDVIVNRTAIRDGSLLKAIK